MAGDGRGAGGGGGGDVTLFGGRVRVPAHLFEERFSRSGGPGGQNVNKVSSRVEIRLPIGSLEPLLTPEEMRRARGALASRLTAEGILRVVSDRFRDQLRNRMDCRERLGALLERALRKKKKRVPTRPSRASKERRLDEKRRRSERKRDRRGTGPD